MSIIDYLKNDGNKSILCHYTSKEAALEHILPSQKIRFSPLRETNDPREYKERVLSITGTIDVEKDIKENFHDTRNKLQEMVLDYSKALCLTKSANDNPLNLNTKRAFGRPRMWSHYGENHKGVGLVFDKQKLTENIYHNFEEDVEQVFSESINYDDRLKSVSLSSKIFSYDPVKRMGLKKALIKHLKDYKNAFFFRKDSDWKGEDEWRYIIHKWARGYEYLKIKDSLIALVLGVDFPEVYLPSVQELCDDNDIELLHLFWDSSDEDFFLRHA